MEAAGRIFGDPDTAMPLIEQLVFEQCTKECRNAITPWKSKGFQAWMKACREIGGPLSNAGLAAAILTSQGSTNLKCYQCGQKGHLKRQCPRQGATEGRGRVPGLCPKCREGKHWANECRSMRDVEGCMLTHTIEWQPKNGKKGPSPQGPQMYGALSTPPQISMRPPGNRGEPL